MKVSDLFEVTFPHSFGLNALKQGSGPDSVNYVSCTSKDNMVSARVLRRDDIDPIPAGAITVAAAFMVAALQPEPFYATYHVAVLVAKAPMGDAEKLWWATCIEANRFRFGFGRKADRTLADLELPDVVPSWVKTATVPDYAPAKCAVSDVPTALDISSWRPFRLGDLFDITKGKTIPNRDTKVGTTPYIRATRFNNGVGSLVATQPNQPAGCMTIANSGNVGCAFFQPEPFIASGHINVLKPRGFALTATRGAFLKTVIEASQFKFNYGRMWRKEDMETSDVLLPATTDGEVNWQWVDTFMESLPYSAGARTTKTPDTPHP